MMCRLVGNLQRYEQLFRIFRLCRLPPSRAVKLFRKVATLANASRLQERLWDTTRCDPLEGCHKFSTHCDASVGSLLPLIQSVGMESPGNRKASPTIGTLGVEDLGEVRITQGQPNRHARSRSDCVAISRCRGLNVVQGRKPRWCPLFNDRELIGSTITPSVLRGWNGMWKYLLWK